MLQFLTSTLTWRGLAASFLGRVTLKTPFLKSAAMFSVSKAVGTEKLRTKAAVVALDAVIALGGVALFERALAGDGERLVFHADVDVLQFDIRQIGFQNQFVFGLVNIDRRRPGAVGLGFGKHAGEGVFEQAQIG